MTCCRDSDARREVEKQIAVHIFDDSARPACANQRIDARVRRRCVLFVTVKQDAGFEPGQGSLDRWNGFALEEPHARLLASHLHESWRMLTVRLLRQPCQPLLR